MKHRALTPTLIAIAALFIGAVAAWADPLAPSRENFFRELVYGQASTVTPRFDDYTPATYHVDPMDILRGLPGYAQGQGATLRALLLLGPLGPLWTYWVISFYDEGDRVRVNSSPLRTHPRSR